MGYWDVWPLGGRGASAKPIAQSHSSPVATRRLGFWAGRRHGLLGCLTVGVRGKRRYIAVIQVSSTCYGGDPPSLLIFLS